MLRRRQPQGGDPGLDLLHSCPVPPKAQRGYCTVHTDGSERYGRMGKENRERTG